MCSTRGKGKEEVEDRGKGMEQGERNGVGHRSLVIGH